MSDTMNISPELLEKMNRYWEAANYLSAGQLYLLDNPLLRKPLTMDHVKKKIVGHWGTVPGQNFIYVHLNRVIKKYDLDMIYISGPGHGGNFMVANTYLEGSYSALYSTTLTLSQLALSATVRLKPVLLQQHGTRTSS